MTKGNPFSEPLFFSWFNWLVLISSLFYYEFLDNFMKALEEYRNSALFYIKMDFGLVAILGSIITLLKLEPSEIADFVSKFDDFVYILLFLLTLGLILERAIVLFSGEIIDSVKKAYRYTQFIRIYLMGLTILHIAFFSYIVVAGVDRARESTAIDTLKRLAESEVRYISTLYELNGFLPEVYPEKKDTTDIIWNNYLSYKKISDDEFRLTIKYKGLVENLSGNIDKGQSHRNRLKLNIFNNAINDYSTKYGHVPFTLTDLLLEKPNLKEYLLEKPFDNFFYAPEDSFNYNFRFSGKDLQLYTKDDLVYKYTVVFK